MTPCGVEDATAPLDGADNEIGSGDAEKGRQKGTNVCKKKLQHLERR